MADSKWRSFGIAAAAAAAMAMAAASSALAAHGSAGPQEPAPPAPQRPAPAPEGAAPLPPVEEPFVTPVPRLDLPGRATPRDVLEGFWELRQRFVGGQVVEAGRGYMAIGRRHVLVQFLVPGSDPDVPLLRAGAYRWLRSGEGDVLRLTLLAGHFNEENGDIKLEVPGETMNRRFEIAGGTVRVHQGGGDWLEFARIE
jgi:hypothetical protein